MGLGVGFGLRPRLDPTRIPHLLTHVFVVRIMQISISVFPNIVECFTRRMSVPDVVPFGKFP